MLSGRLYDRPVCIHCLRSIQGRNKVDSLAMSTWSFTELNTWEKTLNSVYTIYYLYKRKSFWPILLDESLFQWWNCINSQIRETLASLVAMCIHYLWLGFKALYLWHNCFQSNVVWYHLRLLCKNWGHDSFHMESSDLLTNGFIMLTALSVLL